MTTTHRTPVLGAAGFGRAPGLPLLHSRDLVGSTLVGRALERLEPAARFTSPRRGADGVLRLVHRFADAVAERNAGAGFVPSGPVFAATPWHWAGTLLGLFAAAPEGPGHAGAATFSQFRISAQ